MADELAGLEPVGDLHLLCEHENRTLRARLAEAEAERDELRDSMLAEWNAKRAAEARLAAVEAVCDAASGDHIGGVTVVRVPLVRAAVRGEDDRG